MELGKATATEEPIVFDFSTLDLSDNLQQHKGYPLFLAGKASFAEDMQNAVALSHGIDEEGRLDMDMYRAAKEAERYLDGRQGQPVVLVDHTLDPEGKLVRIDALAGVLGTADKLVGTLRRGHWTHGGIALQGSCYQMSAYAVFGPMRLERSIPLDSPDPAETGLMAFDGNEVMLGKPGREDRDDGYGYIQELIAGEDVMEWVGRRFPEPLEGYEIVKGLLQAIRTPEAQAYILQEPYTTLLQAEEGVLEKIQSVVQAKSARVRQLEAARIGVLADASLELAEIEDTSIFPKGRLPYTRDSNHTNVLDTVESLQDLEARGQAVARTQEYLGSLVVKKI